MLNILKTKSKSLAYNTTTTTTTTTTSTTTNESNSKNSLAFKNSAATGEIQRLKKPSIKAKENCGRMLTRQSKIQPELTDLDGELDAPTSVGQINVKVTTLGLVVSRSGRFREKPKIRSRVVSVDGNSFVNIFDSPLAYSPDQGEGAPPTFPNSAGSSPSTSTISPESSEYKEEDFSWPRETFSFNTDDGGSDNRGIFGNSKTDGNNRKARYLSLDLVPKKPGFSVAISGAETSSTQL